MMSWTELAIIAVIVLGIGAAIWRGGGRYPVGTDVLAKEFAVMGSKVTEIEGRVEKIESQSATREDVARLEAQLKTHSQDMKAVEKQIGDLPGAIEANRRAIEKVGKAIPEVESRQRALSDKLSKVQSDGAARSASIDHMSKQLDRLYDVLVERGVDK